ncbi:hypothetical protein FF011L_19780 [Roseimaritima multifibrata]|uniref:GH10 domain-containing protein n=1 Tax=Roseimaritima multifibrata TaxID=1930274 RepID=A0A517MEL4_9BACT|nr:glycoside hydrolase family 10 [Roseimaritima multifibrata]QDS93217.1 hypothetical protein FF011L_19780 [Roseimaritima multifibrata]
MGQFHFDIPELLLEQGAFGEERSLWKYAYLTGIESIPSEGETRFADGRMTISRRADESAKLSVPWNIPGYGPVTLTTCSLRPGDGPYNLALELARGSCYRVRTQADVWERSGLRMSENFKDLLAQGTSFFLDAAQRIANPAAAGEDAMKAIRHLEAASADLLESYAAQALAFRRDHEGQLGTLLGVSMQPAQPPTEAQTQMYVETCNTVAVRLSWADVETDAGRLDFDAVDKMFAWAEKHGLRVIAGPLFDFQDKLLPHWLYLFEDNFDGLIDAVCRFAEQAVRRYVGRVHLWNCAAGLNTKGPIRLSEDQVMRLAVAVVQTVRRVDPRTPVIVAFDQPFGEYLSREREGISPLHCADALVRAGLGLAGIGLELRMNYEQIGTLPRTNLDFSQLVDRWAVLGLPLMCQLTVAANSGIDAGALRPTDVLLGSPPPAIPEKNQLRLAGGFIRTLLAKNFVHGIIWEGWDDSRPHIFPYSGLLDERGNPRPLQQYLARLRKDFLC